MDKQMTISAFSDEQVVSEEGKGSAFTARLPMQ